MFSDERCVSIRLERFKIFVTEAEIVSGDNSVICLDSADYNTDSLCIVDSSAEYVVTQLFTLSIWILKSLDASGNSHSNFLLQANGYASLIRKIPFFALKVD